MREKGNVETLVTSREISTWKCFVSWSMGDLKQFVIEQKPSWLCSYLCRCPK